MKKRFHILDLFCKAGGAGMGYHLAGFEVTGVDIESQTKYPFRFIQGDAFDVLKGGASTYDAIHASPVCKRYSSITKTAGTHELHPDQIEELRVTLNGTGLPYIIENVPEAPLIKPVQLCGTMFGLNVIRHRNFETNWPLYVPFGMACNHVKQVVKHGRRPERDKHYAAVTGHFSDVEFAQKSMGINWMGQKELAQAIPPAYTKWIGERLIEHLMIREQEVA